MTGFSFIKLIKRIGIGILITAGSVAVMFLLPRPHATKDNPFMAGKNKRPLNIAHGGGNKEFPDNTLEAYYNAVSIDPGIMLETDVNMTRDGVIILSHDGTLDRKTNVTGLISEWNYTDLVSQEVDFNYENSRAGRLIPYTTYKGRRVSPMDVTYPPGVQPRHETKFLVTTLEELIMKFPDSPINVEIKQQGETGLRALQTVLELMAELDGDYHTFDRIVLATFHDEIYGKLKEYQKTEYPAMKFSPNESAIVFLYISHWIGLDFFYNEPVTVLQLPTSQYDLPLDTAFFINAAHRHNIAVHYWTVNEPDEMRRLAQNGADGIMTDVPSLLDSVLDEWEMNAHGGL
jgi:glycerophosphoryl diester phosphodiesterase